MAQTQQMIGNCFLVIALITFTICIQVSSSLDYPRWPIDFRWSYAGPFRDCRCVKIEERADPHTWGDNYFCSAGDKADPGMRWSSAGPIPGMRCTQILESADPHTWSDNYLCLPHHSPIHFIWGSAGPHPHKACIQWIEPSDPHTWFDNYLCATPA